MPKWFGEALHTGYQQTFEINRILADEVTPFQRVQILETVANGRVLVLDDIVQLSSRDEFTYSEMLAHVPLFELMAMGAPARRVLIIGGGDGAIAEEVLKHRTVEEVVLAEIDPRVVALCKEHFGEVHNGAFDDPRFVLRLGDGFETLQRADSIGAFDLIIADRPDPVGPAGTLFADPFYEAVARALSPRGIATFQTGVPFYQPGELADAMPQLQRTFPHAGAFLTVTPSYVGGSMALTFASMERPLGETTLRVLERLFDAIRVRTDYYNPEIHKAAFALPPYLRRITNGARLLPGERPRIVATS
ncbi:MAG: polyamine aminopropyltransferase [Alphaproteobacteria bacterium]